MTLPLVLSSFTYMFSLCVRMCVYVYGVYVCTWYVCVRGMRVHGVCV